MEKSNFQFTNPILTRLEFETHNNFEKNGQVNIGINLSVDIQREEIDNHIFGNAARVSVTLRVGAKDESAPFYIEADEEANFRWREDVFGEKDIETLLRQNAVALLISYLRPIVSGITASSPYPAYNLPYIDLTSE